MHNEALAQMKNKCVQRRITIVVPVLNEGAAIPLFVERMSSVLEPLERRGYTFELLFVDDGSTDDTSEVLAQLTVSDARIAVIEFSRNFGKEAALTAGLDAASGDAVVPIDVDLQDPPELLTVMIDRWTEGFEIVLARRSSRRSDSALKRWTARAFYWLHNRLSDVPIPADVGDFRLLDRCAVEALRALPERRRFMKGLFAWVGFKTTVVDYERAPRSAGTTKFSGWRLWNFALEGITSFSSVPLRVWTYVGLAFSLLAFAYTAFIVIRTIFFGVDVPGYASVLAAVLILGGVQLIGIGVIGEYLGRVYLESKHRPIYVVRRCIGLRK